MVEERPRSKPAAVLQVDIVINNGSSFLEARALLQDLIAPTITAESGQIIVQTGDGVLAVFAGVATAVACAIEIHGRHREYQSINVNPDPILLRIGIHFGEIIVEGGNRAGDTFSVAARLTHIADPGIILISKDARDEMHGSASANFVDAGEARLKGIEHPIRLYQLDPDLKPAPSTDGDEPKPLQISISYAHADREIALKIADAVRGVRHQIWIADWKLTIGDTIAERIDRTMRPGDILLILLSPDSVHSRWIQDEISSTLAQELRDRAITIIPALVRDCDIPPMLADRRFIDFRGEIHQGLHRLVDQIAAASSLDFTKLDYGAFERMVADLLRKLGFIVQPIPVSHDGGVDLVATMQSRDPFGVIQSERWIVQAKLYHKQRMSVAHIKEMLGVLSGTRNKGLIVTNRRLTSVMRSFLVESIDKFAAELRVIDGTELTNLLLQHPELIRKYILQQRSDA